MYYRARYYAQGLGRFISADTVVPDGRNPQQFNRYAYAYNNPVNYTDPSGHMPTCDLEAGNGCAPVMDSLQEIFTAYHAGYDGLLAKDHQLADFFRMHPDAEMATNPGILDGDYLDASMMYTKVEMERGNPAAWFTFAFIGWLGSLIGPGSGPSIPRDNSFDHPSNLQQDVAADQDLALPSSMRARTPAEILMPGGQPIGRPGLNEGVQTLSSASEIEDLYNELKVIGTPVRTPSYPGGVMYEMPGGGRIGYRATSNYGGPTIDVYIPGIPFEGIHLP